MNIAFLNTSTGWGGLEMNVLKLARHLTTSGYRITLLTRQAATLFKYRDSFSASFVFGKGMKYFDIYNAGLIAGRLKAEKIKTLMVFDNRDLDLAFWIKKIHGNKLKVIYQQHMQIGINKKDSLHTMRFNAIDAWISPLTFLKEEVIQKTRFPEEKITVIPIGPEVKGQNIYTKEEARNSLGIKTSKPLLGIIGRISRKKGQLFLIEAVNRLREEGIQVELLVFGSPTVDDDDSKNYLEEIRSFISIHEMNDSVHFTAYNKDVQLFYSAIDIFVLASEKETYGMVTIEAMLAGLPVIATSAGGTSEILGAGAYGSLYEYNDYNSFRSNLIWHLNHSEESKSKAMHARNAAQENYSIEKEVGGMEELILRVHRKEPTGILN